MTLLRENVLDLHPDALLHGLADAARVASHQQTGQPLSAEQRFSAIPAEVAQAFVAALMKKTSPTEGSTS